MATAVDKVGMNISSTLATLYFCGYRRLPIDIHS